MILPKSHTLMFMWYLWALDRETQRVLRPFMIIMIDPDCTAIDRYDAYTRMSGNMSHLAKEQDARYHWVSESKTPDLWRLEKDKL